MRFFRDTSIRFKVLIPPAILILALGIVALLALYGLNVQHAALSEVYEIALDKITLIDEFIVLSEQVQSDVFRIAVLQFMDLPGEEIQPIHERLEQGVNDLNIIYGEILAKWELDETERSILERMKGAMDAFRQQALQATAVVADNPSFGILLVRSSTVPFAEFRDTLTEFRDYQQAKIVRVETESYQRARKVSTAIIGVVFLLALTGIAATVLISTRWISRPMLSMAALMRRLAEGDLTIEVGDVERRDEIGAMARAVGVFRNNAIEKAQVDEALRKAYEEILMRQEAALNVTEDLKIEIDERKRAEEALKEYSERLEEMVEERTAQLQTQYTHLDAILRSATDGIIVTDTKGEIVQANPVANTWLTKTLSPEDARLLQEVVQGIARQACAEETGFSGKNPVSLLELTGLDLELKAALISEPGVGEAEAVVAIHDVSHLKALDRMKSRFVTNVSHELRTPVTTIKLYAYLMRRKPEKREQYLDTLAQEADRLAGLVEGILQVSRIDTGRLDMNPQPTPLNELTEIAIISHQALSRKRGLTLEHHPAEPGPLALVDPEPLMQVLNNLVENGIYYTPEGGKVLVSTGKQETEGRVWATVTVADTGMGIPEQELPHTFERFFRGEKPRLMQISGTGLGLAIVEEIVELHGGRVTVESQVDVGTTFTVWLPLAG